MSEHHFAPKDYIRAVAKPGQCANLLLKTLGGRVLRVENGEAELTIPASPDFCQGGGVIGGGVIATLADEAMAHAVLSTLDEGLYTVTLEMSLRYVRAATPTNGADLKAAASLIKRGRTVCVAEARVMDAQDRLLATSQATFLITAAPTPQG